MADCEKIHEMDPFKYKLKTLKIKIIENKNMTQTEASFCTQQTSWKQRQK